MNSVIRKEFRFHNLGLNYDHPECFTSSQWRWPRPVYLIYRIVSAIYTICASVYMVIFLQNRFDEQRHNDSSPYQHPPMVYITSWSYLILTCHCVVAAVIAAVCYRHAGISPPRLQSEPCPTPSDVTSGSGPADMELNHVSHDSDGRDLNNGPDVTGSQVVNTYSPTRDRLPWYSKLSWILVNIILSWSVIVTATYFTAVFEPSWGFIFNDLNTHILNTGFVIIDIFISARPVRLLHFMHPFLFGIVYMIFSIVYWEVGNKNAIYQNIYDWNNAGIAVGFIFGVLLMIIILNSIYFALYRLRLFLFEKIYA